MHTEANANRCPLALSLSLSPVHFRILEIIFEWFYYRKTYREYNKTSSVNFRGHIGTPFADPSPCGKAQLPRRDLYEAKKKR